MPCKYLEYILRSFRKCMHLWNLYTSKIEHLSPRKSSLWPFQNLTMMIEIRRLQNPCSTYSCVLLLCLNMTYMRFMQAFIRKMNYFPLHWEQYSIESEYTIICLSTLWGFSLKTYVVILLDKHLEVKFLEHMIDTCFKVF